MTQPNFSVSGWRPCAVIPVYNHGSTVGAVVAELVAEGLAVILVDDGSSAETKTFLTEIVRDVKGTTLFTLPVNLGKGGAVAHGLIQASQLGYSHALQVDADGQHDLGEILTFLDVSRAQPDQVICGRPVFDRSVPISRLIGRRITNFFVAIETLSRDIPDAMCGFRVYPLMPVQNLLSRRALSQRMDFDIEILVRLHWQAVSMQFRPIRVIYPENGISHFRLLADNLAITRIHAQLTIEMVFRWPWLLWRRRHAGQRAKA